MKYLKIIGVLVVLFGVFIIYRNLDPNSSYAQSIEGDSMSEFGLSNGDNYRVFYNQECTVGDLCELECFKEGCANLSMVKKIIKIEGNCYWVEGNSKHWIEDGQWVASYDSRIFGWLCGNELKINGVVK